MLASRHDRLVLDQEWHRYEQRYTLSLKCRLQQAPRGSTITANGRDHCRSVEYKPHPFSYVILHVIWSRVGKPPRWWQGRASDPARHRARERSARIRITEAARPKAGSGKAGEPVIAKGAS